MTAAQERDLAVRAKRAHERMHGPSTWIESHVLEINGEKARVRVNDHELNIVTYWTVVSLTGHRRIKFLKQLGERA